MEAIKQVDVVISTAGTGLVENQTRIIAAIKEAGNIKVVLILLNWYYLHHVELKNSELFFPSS